MPARRRSKSAKKPRKPVEIAGPLAGPPPDVMLPVEAASHVRLTVSGLYERAARAEDPSRARNGDRDPIPCLRYGTMLRFRRQDLDAWMARRQMGTVAKTMKAAR
jgi:hypothetical protein